MPKVILISGGSDGLGKALAKKLSSDNQVVILAHNKTKLEAAAKELNCDFVEAELTDYISLTTAVDLVIAKYQKIDVLINNAGVWIDGQLDDNDPEKIKEVININSTGTIFLTKAVLPHLRKEKSGLIINIISQDGLCSKKDRSVYHASKWAITGFTKCLQDDLEEENIKVTAVFPGLMKTKLFEKSNVQRDLSEALDPSEVASLVQSVINLDESAYIPEVSIKNKINNQKTMDDTNAPAIDLNIDPDMITPSGDSPQSTSSFTAPLPPTIPDEPTSSPIKPQTPPSIIDITPGAPASIPVPTPPPVFTPAPEPAPEPTAPMHLSDLTAPPAPATTTETAPVISPEPASMSDSIPSPLSSPPMTEVQVSNEPIAQSSPLVEDPDLVKLIK